MNHFEFATASRIVFGRGSFDNVGAEVARLGTRAFVLCGSDAERAESLCSQLGKNRMEHQIYSVIGEPTTEMVLGAVEAARRAGCDTVVAVGGGSVVDTGKVVGAMLTNAGDLIDYLEVIGFGKTLAHPAAPFVAIPTTAGTGAEVTRNAVVGSIEKRVKVSMRSPYLLPRIAVVDPELTVSMPPSVTAATGLDALTQLMEAYVSSAANPLTDSICRTGLTRGARSLRRAFADGEDREAREDLALASLLSGLALANAKLGAVHGFAGPLGGMFSAPHGAICARLLPLVMEANIEAIVERESKSPALGRYEEIARIVTQNRSATAALGVDWIRSLCHDLDVPGIAEYGISEEHIPQAVEKAQKASSMKGNPIELTPQELTQILLGAL